MGGISRVAKLAARFAVRSVFDYPKIIKAKRKHRRGVADNIISTHPGDVSFETNRFAIFLIWQPGTLQWFVKNALNAFQDAKTNVVVVANHSLSDTTLSYLKSQCYEVIVRGNEGYDIGGYRDATLHILKSHAPERMTYLNDSVYLFRKGLSELFTRLSTSTSDICTAFENWEFRYHIQSFCFSVSRKIIESTEFVQFWENYIPANSRRWAIHQGEIGLSKAIVPVARDFDVVFSPNDLREPLKVLDAQQLAGLISYLPFTQRFHTDDKMSKSHLIDRIVGSVASRSQVHTGGFLYNRFLSNPIIKRDLVYRMQLSLYDVEKCLRECPNVEHVDDILAEMRRKGPGTQLPLFKRIQFMDGII